MKDGHHPTDEERERSLGRIPVWLPVDLVHWLVEHDLCGRGADGRHEEECGFIRFRADAALHKEGLKPKGRKDPDTR